MKPLFQAALRKKGKDEDEIKQMWRERTDINFRDLDPKNTRHNKLFSTDLVWDPVTNKPQPACVICKQIGHTAPSCAEHSAHMLELQDLWDEE